MEAPRPRFVGFSTKMYFGRARTLSWLRTVRQALDERPALSEAGVIPFVVPSFPMLVEAEAELRGSGALLGAQTVSWADGALTGEVSASLLAEIGVHLVEIGHAERRAQLGEDDDVVRRKVAATVAAGLRPLLCVGETARAPADEAARQVLAQVDSAGGAVPGLLVAYEPVWAIGAETPAGPEHVNGVLSRVRDELGADVPLVYGGSAGPGVLARLTEGDGIFLGRFAHDPAAFVRVLDEALGGRSGGSDGHSPR